MKVKSAKLRRVRKEFLVDSSDTETPRVTSS